MEKDGRMKNAKSDTSGASGASALARAVLYYRVSISPLLLHQQHNLKAFFCAKRFSIVVISDTHFIADIFASETKDKCLQGDSKVEKYSLYQHPDTFVCAQ